MQRIKLIGMQESLQTGLCAVKELLSPLSLPFLLS
jgi:hypothetical protein